MASVTRWRSAKRPPHCYQDVLVYLSMEKVVTVGWHTGEDWCVEDHTVHGEVVQVTHWQPLPAPPRVRKERKR